MPVRRRNHPEAEPQRRRLPVGTINLDAYNPRLAANEEGRSQPELLRIMAERFKLEELADSIIASGYRPFDPLIGATEEGRVVVLEGNRRIAAIKLLLNPEGAPISLRSRWRDLSRRLPAAHRAGMEEVDITVYPNRDNVDVASYIGFRHVTGVLPWPAFEKATFIALMISKGSSYEELAERLGSYASHVERHYVAYQVVQQAKTAGISGADRMEQFFGVLLRALQSSDIVEFLGLSFPKDPSKSRRPIRRNKMNALHDFVRWTFGDADHQRVISDSRQLTKWGKILNSQNAVRYLRSAPKPDFDRAWSKSGGEAESLVEALHAAADRLEESLPAITREYAANEEVRAAVERCTRYIVKLLRDFPAIAAEYHIDSADV